MKSNGLQSDRQVHYEHAQHQRVHVLWFMKMFSPATQNLHCVCISMQPVTENREPINLLNVQCRFSADDGTLEARMVLGFLIHHMLQCSKSHDSLQNLTHLLNNAHQGQPIETNGDYVQS